MNQIINFVPEGMKGLHFYMEGLNFPVVLATYSEWEETQVSYLTDNIKSERWDTIDVCRWCINHQIQYKMVYLVSKKNVIKHPYKHYKYLRLKHKIKNNLI